MNKKHPRATSVRIPDSLRASGVRASEQKSEMFKHLDLRSKSRTKNRTRLEQARCPHEEAIVAHVAKHLAPLAFVIHEIESELVHLDVHVVAPGAGHEHATDEQAA